MPPELLRPATEEDKPALADLQFRVRAAAFPAMPQSLHPLHEVRDWVSSWDLAAYDVWLAEGETGPVGYARFDATWLDDLYVDPGVQGTGVGTALLDVVKAHRPDGFCLWVFESNLPARGFYTRHGLVDLERTDGDANEEKEPDLRMAWPGSDPVAFFRGLIDEVDVGLGDLLNRRVALTRAVQDHKDSDQRDPAREEQIVAALAARAPAFGADQLGRIVHAIITESLSVAPVTIASEDVVG